MGDRKLQRILDRMGKAKGNTVSVEDGKQEVHEFIQDNAKNPGQAQDAYIAGKDTFNKAPQRKSALNMLGISRKASPLNELSPKCWTGYSPGAKTGVMTKKGKDGDPVNNCEAD